MDSSCLSNPGSKTGYDASAGYRIARAGDHHDRSTVTSVNVRVGPGAPRGRAVIADRGRRWRRRDYWESEYVGGSDLPSDSDAGPLG
jgi:hypothetical protein